MHTFIDTGIGYSILILQILGAVSILLIVIKKYFYTPLPDFLQNHSMRIGLFLSLIAILGSLYYSEVRNLEPCLLCWWQRVFIYPQCIIMLVGLYTREYRNSQLASIVMSVIGASIAVYHVLAQAGIRSTGLPCAANGVSCTTIDLMLLGYITIPVMSLTLYGWLLFVGIYGNNLYTKKTP